VAKIFQLNKNIKFNVETNILINLKGIEVSLENLESKVLQLFSESFGKVVSKDELSQCWVTADHTSDSSITRVISNLRAKLSQLDNSDELLIKNIRKKGYMLSHNINSGSRSELTLTSQYNNEQNTVEFIHSHAPTKSLFNRLPTIYFSSLMLLVLTIYGFSSLSNISKPPYTQFEKPYRLFEDKIRKFELAPSDNGNYIIYSGQHMDSKYWLLGVFDNQTKKLHIIERAETDLTTPTWVSENMLAMRIKNDSSCWVELITITDLINNAQGQRISTCYQQSPLFSMTKISNTELLIADSPAISKGSHLTRLNIFSGTTKLINIANNGGAGVYKVIATPDMNYLAMLTTHDWLNTQLDIVAIDDINTVLWSKHLSFPLFFAAFFDDKISYKGNDGSIMTHYFDASFTVTDTESIPVFMPFDNVTRFADDIIFTKGELYSQNIFLYDFDSQRSIAISSERSERNYMPYRYSEDEVWYISNKTGISQLWSYQLSNKTSRQLSFFTQQTEIKALDVSSDGKLVLLGTNSGIQIFSYEKKQIKELLLSLNGFYPIFHQGKIIFTKIENETYELFSYNLKTQETKKLTSYGGYRAKTDGESIYFDKYNSPGIWQLTNEVEVLSLNLSAFPKRWLVESGQLYIFNQNTVTKFNTITQNSEVLPKNSCQQARQINWNSCLNVMNDNVANQIVILPR